MSEGSNSNRYKTLASDIGIFIIGTVLAKAIQFFLMPLYTTYMTTDAFGVAELTNNLSELLFPIATLCIYEAAFRFAVDPEFENGKLVRSIACVMWKSLVIGLIIAIICQFGLRYKYSFYLFFVLYSYSIRMCAAYYIRGKGYSKVFAISGIVNAISLSAFNIVFLVILKSSETGYLLSLGLSYCCSALYLVFFGRVKQDVIGTRFERTDLRVLYKYCLPLIVYNILYWFTTISGRYVLLFFLGSSVTGKYVAAIKISAVINMVQQAVYAAFQLNSSRAYTEENKEKYYSDITNLFITLYCSFGAVIVCFAPVLAKLTLRNDFYDARVFIPAIMLAALINCISSVLGTMYSTYKKTQRQVGVSIVGAIINIAVGIILTPTWGVWGVCFASICCYISQTVYKFADIKKFCNIKYNWKIIISNMLLLCSQVFIMSTSYSLNVLVAIIITIVLFIIDKRIIINAIYQLRMK